MNNHTAAPGICYLQRSLVAAFNEDSKGNFDRALKRGANVKLKIIRKNETRYSVFDEACSTPGKSAFIEKCLYYGADLNEEHSDTGKYPIHLAAESHDETNLLVLLNQPALLIDQETREGKTALCLLFETITNENWNSVYDCVKLLLKYHANINRKTKDGKTPIQMLLEKGTLDDSSKKHILGYCKINCFVNENDRRTTIEETYGVDIPPYTDLHKRFDDLRDMLNSDSDEQIIAKIDNDHLAEFSDEMVRKLLEMCIYRCKPRAAQIILNSKFVNGMLENPSAILKGLFAKCCNMGAYKMLQLLLHVISEDDRGKDFLNKDPLLHILVTKMDSKVHKISCAFFKCFEMLLKDPRIEIDKRDGFNCTALQIAGRCRNDAAQRLLLESGAYIGGQDIDGYNTIDEINPVVLKEHFDSCVEVRHENDKKQKQEKIIVNVRNLVVPELKSDYEEHKYVHTNDHTFHNVLLVLLHLIKLDSMEANDIILHPAIACWLHLRWLHCRWVWWAEFGICVLFLGCLNVSILLRYYAESNKTEWYTIVLAVLAFIVGLFYADLIFLQIRNMILERVRNIEGVKFILLILSAALFLIYSFSNDDNQRVFASFTLLCSGFVFIVTMGTGSRLSISTYILMLEVVLLNLLKCMIPFVILVSPFVMSFHLLLHKRDIAHPAETNVGHNTTEAENQDNKIENKFNSFNHLGLVLIKAVVMMIGELDAASMPLMNVPFLIMLTLFILSVSIGFFNLMNGLAVSDVVDIREKSTNLRIMHRIMLLHQHDNVVQSKFKNFFRCRKSPYDGREAIVRIVITVEQKKVTQISTFSKAHQGDEKKSNDDSPHWSCNECGKILRALLQVTKDSQKRASEDNQAKCLCAHCKNFHGTEASFRTPTRRTVPASSNMNRIGPVRVCHSSLRISNERQTNY